MWNKKQFDIIVVGAGPAGSTAAKCLAEKDRTVLLLDKGDSLVIYTDGVNEAADRNGKMYGDERVKMRLLERASSTPQDYLNALQEDLKKYTGSDVFEDDIAVLVMDFNLDKG